MSVTIFVGPTLAREDIPRELGFRLLPPAAAGDVYRAVRNGSSVVALVDGYFDQVPSVWHKELLWALSQGVHVFGASSMGALRAAELAYFGMEGVGSIFEKLLAGELEDDDEVAVVHASFEEAFRALSEAMVNIRATLGAALASGVLSARSHDQLVALAKRRHFSERSYASLLSDGADAGVPYSDLTHLRDWLPRGRIDQKREDALLLIQTVRARVKSGLDRKKVGFTFEHTHFWEELCREIDGAGDCTEFALADNALMDELREAGELERTSRAALGRVLASLYAQRAGRAPTPEAAANALNAFRQDHGLLRAEAFGEWTRANELDDAGLQLFASEEACVRWIHDAVASTLPRAIRNHLRATGDYPALLAKARRRIV